MWRTPSIVFGIIIDLNHCIFCRGSFYIIRTYIIYCNHLQSASQSCWLYRYYSTIFILTLGSLVFLLHFKNLLQLIDLLLIDCLFSNCWVELCLGFVIPPVRNRMMISLRSYSNFIFLYILFSWVKYERTIYPVCMF